MRKPDIHNLLKTRFGYDDFRPLQAEIIQTVLAERDALVLMPTGGASRCATSCRRYAWRA